MRFKDVWWELTSSFQDLTRALGAIRQRQGDNLVVSGEFDLCAIGVSFSSRSPSSSRPRTLSRMTSGPFTPPMVLYRIRGWTDIMRGSRLDMAAVG